MKCVLAFSNSHNAILDASFWPVYHTVVAQFHDINLAYGAFFHLKPVTYFETSVVFYYSVTGFFLV